MRKAGARLQLAQTVNVGVGHCGPVVVVAIVAITKVGGCDPGVLARDTAISDRC